MRIERLIRALVCLAALVTAGGAKAAVAYRTQVLSKCLVTDRCRKCDAVEQKERYCTKTGHREELECEDEKQKSVVAYDSCEEPSKATTAVIQFEVSRPAFPPRSVLTSPQATVHRSGIRFDGRWLDTYFVKLRCFVCGSALCFSAERCTKRRHCRSSTWSSAALRAYLRLGRSTSAA